MGRGTTAVANSMGRIALGGKNWIHAGSAQAGVKVATIRSVMESGRRMNVPGREYLATVLPGLNNLSIQNIPGLSPAPRKANHNQPAACRRPCDSPDTCGSLARESAPNA